MPTSSPQGSTQDRGEALGVEPRGLMRTLRLQPVAEANTSCSLEQRSGGAARRSGSSRAPGSGVSSGPRTRASSTGRSSRGEGLAHRALLLGSEHSHGVEPTDYNSGGGGTTDGRPSHLRRHDQRSPELRHEVPLPIPDAFLYVERDGARYVFVSSLELPRIVELGVAWTSGPTRSSGSTSSYAQGIDRDLLPALDRPQRVPAACASRGERESRSRARSRWRFADYLRTEGDRARRRQAHVRREAAAR